METWTSDDKVRSLACGGVQSTQLGTSGRTVSEFVQGVPWQVTTCSHRYVAPSDYGLHPSRGLRTVVTGRPSWVALVGTTKAWLRPVGVQRGTRAPGRSAHPASWLTVVGSGSDGRHQVTAVGRTAAPH